MWKFAPFPSCLKLRIIRKSRKRNIGSGGDFKNSSIMSPSSSAKKLAKSFLKKDPQNLLLWNIYAQIELQAGNVDECRKVYQNALSLHQTFASEQTKPQALVLYKEYANLEWRAGRVNLAMGIILAAMEDGQPPSPPATGVSADLAEPPRSTRLLKVRKQIDEKLAAYVAQHQQRLMSSSSSSLALLSPHAGVSVVFLCTLFDYLVSASTAEGLEEANKRFDQILLSIPPPPSSSATSSTTSRVFTSRRHVYNLREETLLCQARLNKHHIETQQKGGFKPGILREILQRSVSEFPHNLEMWSVFKWNEARSRIENRLRSEMNRLVLQGGGGSSNSQVFSLWCDIHQPHHTPSESVMRMFFEKSLEHKR